MGKKKNREMLFWTKEEYLKSAEAMMDTIHIIAEIVDGIKEDSAYNN